MHVNFVHVLLNLFDLGHKDPTVELLSVIHEFCYIFIGFEKPHSFIGIHLNEICLSLGSL